MRHASKALRKPLEFKTDHRRSAHQIEAKSLIDKPTRDLMLSIGDKLFGAPEKAAAQATHDHGVGFDARGRALNGRRGWTGHSRRRSFLRSVAYAPSRYQRRLAENSRLGPRLLHGRRRMTPEPRLPIPSSSAPTTATVHLDAAVLLW